MEFDKLYCMFKFGNFQDMIFITGFSLINLKMNILVLSKLGKIFNGQKLEFYLWNLWEYSRLKIEH